MSGCRLRSVFPTRVPVVLWQAVVANPSILPPASAQRPQHHAPSKGSPAAPAPRPCAAAAAPPCCAPASVDGRLAGPSDTLRCFLLWPPAGGGGRIRSAWRRRHAAGALRCGPGLCGPGLAALPPLCSRLAAPHAMPKTRSWGAELGGGTAPRFRSQPVLPAPRTRLPVLSAGCSGRAAVGPCACCTAAACLPGSPEHEAATHSGISEVCPRSLLAAGGCDLVGCAPPPGQPLDRDQQDLWRPVRPAFCTLLTGVLR